MLACGLVLMISMIVMKVNRERTYEGEGTGNDHAESGSAVDGSSTGEDWRAGWGWWGGDTGGSNRSSTRWSWEAGGWSWGDGWLANSDVDSAGEVVSIG